MGENAESQTEIPTLPALDCVTQEGHKVTAQEMRTRHTEDFLDHQAAEKRPGVFLDRRHLSGTVTVEHEGVAALERAQLENPGVYDAAELRSSPCDPIVIEELRRATSELFERWGQLRGPLAGEQIDGRLGAG
jgi:hypothetical protein